MKPILVRFASFVFVLFLAGCASGSHSYFPSSRDIHIVNTAELQLPKDLAWNKLVTGLASGFYVINNMDKQSGFVNVSYSGDPEQYVDGGELLYSVKNARGKREYRFPASRARAQYEALVNNNLIGVTRQLDLEGRLNILLSEISPSITRITVNVRYLLTLKATGQDVMGNPVQPYQETISFNTGQSATSSGGAIYRASGVLEQSILDLFK